MNKQCEVGPRVFCPTCGKKMLWDTRNKYRPFCSERCKLVDLGQWATERYSVAGEPVGDESAVLGMEQD
jgi:endogenous inhibitor of DNA gyrase (YacG/DUF329 family)